MVMHVTDKELLEFLLDAGLASKRDLDAALADATKGGFPLSRVVVMRGILSENDLRRASGFILGIPFIDLRDARLDFSTLSLIPEPVSRAHNAVAFRRGDGSLEVAFLDLDTLPEVKFVEEMHGLSIVPHLTDPESVKRALVFYQDGLKKEYGETMERDARSLSELSKPLSAHSDSELRDLAEEGRTTRLVDSLLRHALLARATNIHIEPTDENVRVRYRIGGKLHEAVILPKHIGPRLGLRTKHIAGLNLRPGIPQDGKFIMARGTGETPFRVSVAPTHHGEKIMMRVLPGGNSGFTLESLGMRGDGLEMLERALHKKEGLILAAGPKVSGKSTFLYTALDILNDPHLSIHTVEKNIEFLMPRANQTAVDTGVGLTFARATRAAARGDADVVMVSDIADSETAKVASAAALSGELILGGVTADSAVKAIHKLLEMGADRKLLASALSVSVGMRVVNRLGRERDRYFLNASELRSLGTLIDLEKTLEVMKREGVVAPKATWSEIPFWKDRRGLMPSDGKIGLFEVLPVTPRVRELVMNGAGETSIIEEGKRVGMITLLEDGIIKAVQGLVSLEEVLRAVS